MKFGWLFCLLDIGDKPVALARHGLDKPVTVRLAQCTPQLRDVVVQIVFFHRAVGPDALHQLVFADEMPVILDEDAESIEDLRTERDEFAFTQLTALGNIKLKTAKLIDH